MKNQEENNLNTPEEQLPEEKNEQTADTKETNTENTSESASLEAQLREANDKYLRLYSEFDNYRKRTMKEKSDIIRSAGEDVFKSILPVIDDFERAMKANEAIDDAASIKEGIQLIYNKLKNACVHKGLEPLESIGKTFDVDQMEAITHIPAPSEDMKGKVIDEVEKGYKLGEKVIRYAKVVVGN